MKPCWLSERRHASEHVATRVVHCNDLVHYLLTLVARKYAYSSNHRRDRTGWRLPFAAPIAERVSRDRTAASVGIVRVVGERLRWLRILDDVELVDADLFDLSSLFRVIAQFQPDELYNLAAQSFVAASWRQPLLTGAVTGLGAVNVLEAVRAVRPTARFYQASSSEMFGLIQQPVQNERTPFYPRSPYAAAKLHTRIG